LFRGEVLITVGGRVEGKSFVVQLDHDLSDCALGERISLLLLDCHQLALKHFQFVIEVEVH
jgi:hypothetical protein